MYTDDSQTAHAEREVGEGDVWSMEEGRKGEGFFTNVKQDAIPTQIYISSSC